VAAVFISMAVVGASLLWPISRWVMESGESRKELYGFCGCLTAAVTAAVIAAASGQDFLLANVWLYGVSISVSFVLGYWLVIMHCLTIGPAGPTVAMNNMGMVWPVILGVLWLRPRPLNALLVTGLLLVCLALVLMGSSRSSEPEARDGPARKITPRWVLWAFLGWALAGVSMTIQVPASMAAKGNEFVLSLAFTGPAAIMLAPLAFRRRPSRPRGREVTGGVISGVVIAMMGAIMPKALQHAGPELVFPITTGAPVVVMLILGRLLYQDRLGALAWAACVFGVVGITLLSVGNSG